MNCAFQVKTSSLGGTVYLGVNVRINVLENVFKLEEIISQQHIIFFVLV